MSDKPPQCGVHTVYKGRYNCKSPLKDAENFALNKLIKNQVMSASVTCLRSLSPLLKARPVVNLRHSVRTLTFTQEHEELRKTLRKVCQWHICFNRRSIKNKYFTVCFNSVKFVRSSIRISIRMSINGRRMASFRRMSFSRNWVLPVWWVLPDR